MIDASGFYTNHQNRNHLEVGDLMEAYHTDIKNVSRTVLYKDIQDMDFSWDVNAYLQEALICPDGFNISLLEDLVSLPHLETATIGDKGLVVKVSDLSDDWSRPYVHLENMEQESISRAYACLDREAILVSTIRTLKPSIIKASKECPVCIPRAFCSEKSIHRRLSYSCFSKSKRHGTSRGYKPNEGGLHK